MARLFLIALSLLFSATPLFASEAPTRVYLSCEDPAGVLTDNLHYFNQPLLSSGAVSIAADAEVLKVMADCREDLEVDAAEERRCRLQAIRRVMVDYWLQLSIRDSGGGMEISLKVREESGELVHHDFLRVETEVVEDAAREALPLLADGYLNRFHAPEQEEDQVSKEATLVPQNQGTLSFQDVLKGEGEAPPPEITADDGTSWLLCAVGQRADNGGWCDGRARRYDDPVRVLNACPRGFELPSVEHIRGLLGECRAGHLSDLHCAACDESDECAGLFGKDERVYWLSDGRMVDFDSGRVKEEEDEAAVRCVRSVSP